MATLNEVHLEIVGWCNAACDYCTWTKRGTPKMMMPVSLATRLIDECAAHKIKMNFNGVGEPTLHPDLERILAAADRAGVEYRFATNGSKLDSAALSRRPLALDIAAHYSLPPKFVERCRGETLRFLESRPLNREVVILLVCTRGNMRHYDQHIATFLPLAEALPNVKLYLKQPLTWPESDPVFGEVRVDLLGHPKVLVETVATPRSIAAACDMPTRFLLVRADGTVIPCCVGLKDWGLGTIGERTLQEVWESPEMGRMRAMWKDASDAVPCGRCKRRRDCLTS